MSNAGVQSWTLTPADNIAINGININEFCAAAGINNAIRQAMSSVMQELVYQGADLSASASISLAGIDYRQVAISGSASIIHAGTGRAGLVRVTKWNSPSTLVGSTLLLTDGGGNIVTATNDVTMFLSFGASTWRAVNFPISGLPPALGGSVTSSASIGDSVFGLSGAGVAKRIPASVTASAGSIVVWDAGPKYPAGDGSQITNLPSSTTSLSYIKNSDQAVAGATFTKITFTSQEWDDGSLFSSSTFTPTSGKWRISACIQELLVSILAAVAIVLYKNGSAYKYGSITRGATGGWEAGSVLSVLVSANGTDTFEVYAYTDAATTISGTSPRAAYFQASKVS